VAANIELYVGHAIGASNPWGEATGAPHKRVTRADLRALAAYLSAMSEEPVEGEVTIGRLKLTLHVDRCIECGGGGRRGALSECARCSGTGREPGTLEP